MSIKIYPEKVLRKKAALVEDENLDDLFEKLVTNMIAYEGIGLAAPQIGIGKSVAVISENADEKLDKPIFLINPEIIESTGEQAIEEGCLSVLDIRAVVKRAKRIKVETGIPGNRQTISAEGLVSIVIQHEVDHLNGIIFLDRLKMSDRLWYLFKARLNKRYAKKT